MASYILDKLIKYLIATTIFFVLIIFTVFSLESSFSEPEREVISEPAPETYYTGVLNDKSTQPVIIKVGCDYGNPSCKEGFKCKANSCVKEVEDPWPWWLLLDSNGY